MGVLRLTAEMMPAGTTFGVTASFSSSLPWASVVTTIAFAAAYFVPIAPVDSDWARRAFKVNEDFGEEIGWPELVQKLVQIRDSLGPAERSQFGILAGKLWRSWSD